MKFDMGYEDEDINIEALALSHGNINRAISIIKDSGVKPNVNDGNINEINNNMNNNSTPSLPQRKENAGAIFDSSKAGAFNWLDDVTTAATSNSNNVNNEIYQYVDPNTGAIYYIDANGQQYIDPEQQQQQQQPEMNAYQLLQAQHQQELQRELSLQQQQLLQQPMLTQQQINNPALTELQQQYLQQYQQQQQQFQQQQQQQIEQYKQQQQQQLQQLQQINYF